MIIHFRKADWIYNKTCTGINFAWTNGLGVVAKAIDFPQVVTAFQRTSLYVYFLHIFSLRNSNFGFNHWIKLKKYTIGILITAL